MYIYIYTNYENIESSNVYHLLSIILFSIRSSILDGAFNEKIILQDGAPPVVSWLIIPLSSSIYLP